MKRYDAETEATDHRNRTFKDYEMNILKYND